MPQAECIRKCLSVITCISLVLLLASCIRRFTEINGVLVPTAGFPGYENSGPVDGGEHLKFDGIYFLRNPFGEATPRTGATTVCYFRFWADGSMLFGYVQRKIPVDASPTAQDADDLSNVYVGKYRYDPISHNLSTFEVFCGDRWYTHEYKDMLNCTADGRLILLPPGANWGVKKIGMEWKFIEIEGLKQEPFW